jgi:hypothetical protein
MPKWVLYMMLFSTPAANVTGTDQTCLGYKDVTDVKQIIDCRPKFERNRIWSLQTASQMEFNRLESCFGALDKLMVNSNVAATMTLRAWCICDGSEKKCPTDIRLKEVLGKFRDCESAGDAQCHAKLSTEAESLVEQPGQASSIIQLYPAPTENKPANKEKKKKGSRK